MKATIKIAIITLIFIIILSTNIFAVDNIFSQADNWIQTGQQHTSTTMDTAQLMDTSEIIYNVFLGIGTAVAVIVGAILGVQFMTAGVEKKVQVKEALFPYIISCIVIFGSFGIWKLVVTILNGIDL